MLSEELYIMDKNMERLMVSELKEEAEQAKSELEAARAERDKAAAELNDIISERDSVAAERDIFKLKCANKTPETIAQELHLSIEYVNSVLAELEIS